MPYSDVYSLVEWKIALSCVHMNQTTRYVVTQIGSCLPFWFNNAEGQSIHVHLSG